MNTVLKALIGRNVKLYFKDKSTFFMSLITPMILLVLFVTFLGNVYESSFLSFLPEGMTLDESVVKSFSISWLLSSLLGVSCVTVAFCSNIIMAQDKINGSIHDILVAPVKKSTLALSYFIANVITTTIVCLAVTALGLIYISTIGWYFTFQDVAYIVLDVLLSVLFGTSLAAIVESFISSQGGIGAVSTFVSSLYGFICGAYMPISQFSEGIRNFISCLPGTYSIGLLRNHFMGGVLNEISKEVPNELVEGMKDGFDANLYFFGNKVEVWHMYAIVGASVVIFIAVYVLMCKFHKSKSK